MNVNGVKNKVNTVIGKGVNRVVQWSPVSNFLKKGVKDPAGFAAKMLVVSLVSKDFVNGVIYTYQSATNKRIPEDKRGFNAWLDGIQGVFNVFGQILSYFIVDRTFTPKWFGKGYSGTFKHPDTKQTIDLSDKYGDNNAKKKSLFLPDNIRCLVDDTIDKVKSGKDIGKDVKNHRLARQIADLIKDKKNTLNDMNGEALGKLKQEVAESLIETFKESGSKFKSVEKGFGLIIAALATNALVKRTLTPLIATPMAAHFSDRKAEKQGKKQEGLDMEATAIALGRYAHPVNAVSGSKNDLTQDQFKKSVVK